MWLGHTPLSELRIPLCYFTGTNLRRISEVEIRFDQTDRGAIMLSGIYVL